MRLISTPSRSAVLESSAMVRNPRPRRVRDSSSDRPQIKTTEASQPQQLRNADHETADPPVGAAEQLRHALQLRSPIGDGEILEQNQERHRAHQRHELLGVSHPAPGEALDHKRSGSSNRERTQPGERPRHAMPNEHPRRHAADHEQAGDAEVEKLQHANRKSQRDADHGVDRAEHQSIDDLLRENGPPLDPPPTPALEYDFPDHCFMRHFAVERRKSLKIVARQPPRLRAQRRVEIASCCRTASAPAAWSRLAAPEMDRSKATGDAGPANGCWGTASRSRHAESRNSSRRSPDWETRRDTARNTTP